MAVSPTGFDDFLAKHHAATDDFQGCVYIRLSIEDGSEILIDGHCSADELRRIADAMDEYRESYAND